MGDHLKFGEHLNPLPHEAGIRATFLGQAHIAGTGPDGKTCRECAFYGLYLGREIVDPGHYSKKDKTRAGLLKNGSCHRFKHLKSNKRFTHEAKACLLFEQCENPPAAVVVFE